MIKKYRGDFEKWGNILYGKSIFVDKEKMLAFLENPTANGIAKDPAYIIQKSILDNYFEKIMPQNRSAQQSLEIAERLYIDGLRKMHPNNTFYPNANFTMRLTYGSVGEYRPGDAVIYGFDTTLDGVIEKMDNKNPEFIVHEKLVELYRSKNYGPYVNDEGKLNVCFISNNDITGGNSGSPVINGKGHLIGCAFDGNWEAMSGDIAFEEELQRTISVDVRYILFIIDKFAGASNIIDELTLVQMSDQEKEDQEKEETLQFIENIKNLITEFPEILNETINDSESNFSNTFLKARKNNQTSFEWNGQIYNTKLEAPTN
jgi:hypothetical protein